MSEVTQIQSNYPESIFSSASRYSALKIYLALGFALVVYNLLVLFFHLPTGYVVDIYSEFPPPFFGALILCYLFAAFALFSGHEIGKKLGALLLVLNHAVILLIPYMLGYYSMGRADDMSYIGEYASIANTGSISSWDIYPASPILGAALKALTGLPANGAAFIIPIVFSFIFIGGLYLWSRFFLKEEKQIQIALLASFVLYLGPYNFLNVPHALFFAYMPLYLFSLSRYIQNKSISNAMLIIIPTVLVPFMHPFIVLFVFSLLLALVVFGRVSNRFTHGEYQSDARPLLLLVVGFFSWFIYSSTLMESFAQSYYSFIRKATEPVIVGTMTKISHARFDPGDLLVFVSVYYGRYVIPLLIVILGCASLYINRKKVSEGMKNYILFFSILYLLFFVIEVILLLNPIISHQPDRLTNLNFIVYAQVPLFALALYVITPKTGGLNRQTILPIILIVGIWSLSFWGAFSSPHTFKTNEALTYNEVDGMAWFHQSGSYDLVLTPLSQLVRFHDLFHTHNAEKYRSIPDHFGYESSNRSFAENNKTEGKKSYVILLTMDELLYQSVPGYKEVGRYTSDDYVRFRNDLSIDGKIYDNLNIEIFT
jgi:hypothetical protein